MHQKHFVSLLQSLFNHSRYNYHLAEEQINVFDAQPPSANTPEN